jgi:hypothetical protein
MRRFLQPALLVVCSAALALLASEGVLRLLARPSPVASATLFGLAVPPLKIIPDGLEAGKPPPETPLDRLQFQGRLITRTDLSGVFREDDLVGYVPRENAVSDNGWWQSNALGARSRMPVTPPVPQGKVRLLILGESYAAGSRVPQEETWASALAEFCPHLDVVDFGVDGYSVGQAFLRYTQLKDRLDYGEVVFVFVPTQDLWRDVNVMRSLMGWQAFEVLPRYVLDHGALRLVRSPYHHLADVIAGNRPIMNPRLREYLERNDSLFRPKLYRVEGPLRHSIIYRTLLAETERRAIRQTLRRVRRPDGEAMGISTAVFRQLRDELGAKGKRFVLAVLPSERDLPVYRAGGKFRTEWIRLVDAACREEPECVDLMPLLLGAPLDSLDRGYTGNHYGPRANRQIARALQPLLDRPAPVRPTQPPLATPPPGSRPASRAHPRA